MLAVVTAVWPSGLADVHPIEPLRLQLAQLGRALVEGDHTKVFFRVVLVVPVASGPVVHQCALPDVRRADEFLDQQFPSDLLPQAYKLAGVHDVPAVTLGESDIVAVFEETHAGRTW